MVIAWLIALDVFARAGLRERDTGTSALVFTAPGAGWRLLAARVLVSCTLSLALVAALTAVTKLLSPVFSSVGLAAL